MKNRMFITSILALSLAITGISSTQARADAEDVAKIIAGVAAVAIIGAAIANRKDRRREHVTTRTYDPYWGGNQGGLNRGHGYQYQKPHHKARPFPNRARNKLLPRQCLIQVNSRDKGRVRGYSGPCLQNKYARFNRLPRQCATRIGNHGKRRVIYKEQCLQRYGYFSAGRR